MNILPRRFTSMHNFIQKRHKGGLKKMCYKLSVFHKYGLWRDDLLWEDDIVKEALRRLPDYIIDERNYRIMRAMQVNLTGGVLPKAQWTAFEDDILYLTPFVEDVIREKQEEKLWNNNH